MHTLKQLFLVFTLIFGYVSLNSDIEARSHHSKKKEKDKKHKKAKKGKKSKKSKANKKPRHSYNDASHDE
jgi:hypothetical protein